MEINNKIIEEYRKFLIKEEKAKETIERYVSEIKTFILENSDVSKELLIQYKQELIATKKKIILNSL